MLSAAAAHSEACRSHTDLFELALVLTLYYKDAGSGRRDSMNGGSGNSSRGHPFCYDVLTQGAGAQTLSCKCGHKYVYIAVSSHYRAQTVCVY
jgi:hypothetical protein